MKKFNITNIEVMGSGVLSIIEGLGSFKSLAQQLINECQIGDKDTNGNFHLKNEGWYPLEKSLLLTSKILEKIGPTTMKNIGTKIPETVIFPPHIKDIYSAVESVNIAYHMNHKKNGKIMFDVQTGEKLDGIGFYGYEPISGQKKIISVCDTPYLTHFDEGVILGIAKKFEPSATIALDKTKPSRRDSGDSDTFIITW